MLMFILGALFLYFLIGLVHLGLLYNKGDGFFLPLFMVLAWPISLFTICKMAESMMNEEDFDFFGYSD